MKNSRKQLCFVTLFLVALAGCSAPESGKHENKEHSTSAEDPDYKSAPEGSTYLNSVESRNGGDIGSRSTLCQLVKDIESGAGVFTVESIYQHPKKHPGMTFVKLDLNTEWVSNTPKEPILSYHVGPMPDGTFLQVGPLPAFNVGNKIGAILQDLDKYKIAFPQKVFRKRGSEVTNGYRLFKGKGQSYANIGSKVQKLHTALEKGNACPFDVEPTSPPPNKSRNDMSGDDEVIIERKEADG